MTHAGFWSEATPHSRDYMYVTLSPPDECVRFGSVVQLLAPNVSGAPAGDGKKCCLALSCLPSEAEVDSGQHLAEGCLISASPQLDACVRNSFIICSADDPTKDGQPLHYGDSFVLRPAAAKDGEILYVYSKVGLLTTEIGKSGEPCLQLMSIKDVDTRWHCLFIDPKYRFETTGSPVLPNQKLIVCHSSSNRRLAVEHAFWFQTLFGLECEVSIHTILDAQRRESEKNIWIIATQKYGENKLMT
ncbi:cilia- and flagella-associated protein 161-like [Hetaerina americana]|uniref:cilia- and flagella-associated protein 161-like n=1 Tax=Hetaerina americana TaxID=62018 RepID=UPI003A7F417C